MSVNITITQTHTISSRELSDLLVTAFEGGSNYWLQSAQLTYSSRTPRKSERWYGQPEILDGAYRFEVGFDDPKKPEGNGEGRKTIVPIDMQKAMQKFADEQPTFFHDLVGDEHLDADGADVFMQYLVLGEVVYG